MALVFIVLGVLFLVTSVRGTQGTLYSVLKSEFTGSNSFIVWASAILILGLVGYWRRARPATDAFIALIFLVLILHNKGFFAQFNAAIRAPAAPGASTSPAGGSIFGPIAQTLGADASASGASAASGGAGSSAGTSLSTAQRLIQNTQAGLGGGVDGGAWDTGDGTGDDDVDFSITNPVAPGSGGGDDSF